MRTSLRLAMATGWLTGFLWAEAKAQELDPRLYPRFELDASGTLLVLSETIRIDPEDESKENREINVEDVLGVSTTSLQPRASFRWRPGRRHELELGFQRAVRSAEKVLVDTVEFRDTTFAAGLRVNSQLRTSQAFLNYRFAFRVRPESQIGATLGLGALLLRQELDAVSGATAGGPDTTIVPYSQTRSFNAPTGSVGVYGRFKLGEQWYLDSDVRAIYVKIDNLKAGVLELGAAARRFFSEKFAAELGYNLGFYTVELERTSDGSHFLNIDATGKIKYTVNGFRGGIVYQF
ncbi:MAG TPA: hypothetical protein VIM84_07710 [Gemmatimonadales bacterium]